MKLSLKFIEFNSSSVNIESIGTTICGVSIFSLYLLKALFKSILNPLIILFLLHGFLIFLLYIFEETEWLIGWLIYLSFAVIYNWYHWNKETATTENPKQAEKANAEMESIRKIAKKRDPNVEAILEVHRIKYGAYEKMRNSD
jgi:hypothetical protein